VAPISVVAGPALVPSSRGVSPGSHEPPNTIYQHPLAYLLTTEGLALLRSWSGDFDEEFVRARLDEVRRLMANETLASHPGVHVESGATDNAYRQWAPTYDEPGNDLLVADLRMIDEVLAGRPAGTAVDAACGTGRGGWSRMVIECSAWIARRRWSSKPAARCPTSRSPSVTSRPCP